MNEQRMVKATFLLTCREIAELEELAIHEKKSADQAT